MAKSKEFLVLVNVILLIQQSFQVQHSIFNFVRLDFLKIFHLFAICRHFL